MSTDDLDRSLATEESLEPSSGFTASVMARVREAASELPPLPFPWLRFFIGAILLIVSTSLGGWIISLPAAETWRSALAATLAAFGSSQASAAAGATLGSLLGTLLLVRLTLSWTGGRD